MNDKKTVYRLIAVCDVDVNAIHGEASPEALSSQGGMRLHEQQQNTSPSFDCMDQMNPESGGEEDPLYDEFLDGCSLLHLACQTADIGMVELLLQHGANIHACDSKGQTPLHHSLIRGRNLIAKLLLSRYSSSATFKFMFCHCYG